MDYTSLTTAVGNYMNRSDLDTEIPDFIQRAEEEMNAFLARNHVRPMVKTYSLSADAQRLDLPDDFIDVIELSASDGTDTWPLARIEPGRQFEAYAKALPPAVTYDADYIRHYKIMGTTLVLSAAPASTLTLTLDCYTKLEPISDSNATNWLMTAHGDAYLFGVLAHAAHRIRDYAFRDENRNLFQGVLELVASSYPEKKRDIALRATDAPWATRVWNPLYG